MRRIAFVLGLAVPGCLAPADEAGDATLAQAEQVVETRAAITTDTSGPDPTAPTTDGQARAPDPSEWMSRNVPVWNVYLGGLGYDRHVGNPLGGKPQSYWTTPSDSDANAPLIFVRPGDEAAPERWVELRAWHHWMMGDAYFEKLIGCGRLSPLDLLAMRAALLAYDDLRSEPPSVYTLPAATGDAILDVENRSRAICPPARPDTRERAVVLHQEGGDYNPFPGWIPSPHPGDDHTGPAPSRGPGSRGTPGSGTAGSSPHQGKGGRGVVYGTPNDGFGPNSHRNGRPATSSHEQQNGIFPGDPKPIPFESPEYEPAPGEKEETFRCGGVIYRGYKHGCVDFSNDSSTRKWDRRMGRFAQKYFADGSATCKNLCSLGGTSPGLFALLCIGSTTEVAGIPCAYILVASAVGGWLGGATFPDWCAERWCNASPPVVSRHECQINPDGKTQTCHPVRK